MLRSLRRVAFLAPAVPLALAAALMPTGGAAEERKAAHAGPARVDAKVAKAAPFPSSRVRVLEGRAIRALFTVIRDEKTSPAIFAPAADRLMHLLAEEALASLPGTREASIKTPCGVFDGLRLLPPEQIAVVSVVRSGDTLLEAVRHNYPGIAVGKLVVQRDESSPEKTAKLIFSKLPHDITRRSVMLVDPMLATGGSARRALEVLNAAGVRDENILFVCVVAAPEGITSLTELHPNLTVITAAIDERLNEHKYIVPGLGDFGDRYYGTEPFHVP
jgi:uracil phosphoribosyltransferase